MSDVAKYSVVDPRIVQKPASYAVEKGALSLTNSRQTAIANSSSQQAWNIQVPSENVFIDRAIDWNCRVPLIVKFTPTATVASGPLFQHGKDWALPAFPAQQCVSVTQATINDTTTTINTSDVLNQVLRLVDLNDSRRQRTCPTMLDRYTTYPVGGVVNSPLSSYDNAVRSDCVPNGAWGGIRYYTSGTFATPIVNGTAGVSVSTSGVVDGVGGDAQGYGVSLDVTTAVGAGEEVTLFMSFDSCEKVVLSPFIFGDEFELSTGLFGVQNIQLQMNLQSPQRVVRTAADFKASLTGDVSVAYGSPSSQGVFLESYVNVQFLTPSLDVPLPPKSIVPYMEFPRYITTGQPAITALSTGEVQSNTITLPNIPDYLYIYAKPQSYGSSNTGDFVCPITKIAVNFDNFSGLLASHTQQQLYKMSVFNGLDMDWDEWSAGGTGQVGSAGVAGSSYAPLCGGPLLLRPSRDIVLQAGQAPALVGQFTFQFTATLFNPSASSVSPLIYVVAISSGFFETIKGSSRIIKGVLTEQDILSAPAISEPVTDASLNRPVGAGRKSHASPLSGMGRKKHAMSGYM
jgi:hypothetical protein